MSLSKRDIELIQLGFKCFESPPKVNFEKLASIAGLKNASSAQTCYNGAKRKFLSATAGVTYAAALATGSTSTPTSSPSAPASKKRKTSAKTITSKTTKGKGGKGTTKAAKGRSATAVNTDEAFDADDDAEDDDEELGEELDVKNVLAFISDEAAASAADMQLKFDDDAHTVKQDAAPTPDNGDHHAAAKTNAGEKEVRGKEVQPTTVVKTEAQTEAEVKAKDLLRKAVRMALNTSLGDEVVAVKKDGDSVSSGKQMVDLTSNGGEKGMETSTAAVAKTVSGLEGGQVSEKVDGV